MTRKMATIRRIDSLSAIEGADLIELAHIGGWKVVVKKGEYAEGDMVVYCEVDSWIPHELAPFLTKPGQEPKEYSGVLGQRLRTVKLRGQISQGLILPLTLIERELSYLFDDGEDMSETLGILKWEAPPEFMPANSAGNFPSFIPKTDQERVQNLAKQVQKWIDTDTVWEVTEKLDGSSMTVFLADGEFGVCSRNLKLKEDDNNTYWSVAKSQGLLEVLGELGWDCALQGELCGPGIQGNPYGLHEPTFFLYDMFDIQEQEYLLPGERQSTAKMFGIKHVPVHENGALLADVETLLTLAEGLSVVGKKPQREGFVYKNLETQESFKVISNKWLLKNE